MIEYSSSYSHLVTSGCSFTHNNHQDTHCVWANTLAVWSGWTIDNLAVPGAGNAHIKNSTILHLERTRPDPANTVVMIMWSGPERIDWITDRKSSNFKDLYSFPYYYTDENEIVLGGSWWARDFDSLLLKTLTNYSKFQSESSLALQSWLHIQDLENYLKLHGYNYYFLSWFDYSDPVDRTHRWIEFDQEIARLGLTLDRSRWLAQGIDRSVGRWTLNRPEYILEDGIHSGWQGHEAWLRAVLIPELLEKGVVNELARQ